MKWLITFLFLFTIVNAEEITTGNLLPNAGDGVDWGSNSTDQINPGGSGYVNSGDVVNGFTITCPESQANCGYKHSTGGDFEVTGTSTVSVNDIDLTNDTRTQEMLDNGITLNSYIDVANCDSQPGNCEGRSGNADSHTVVIELKDSDGNVLSTTTQTRTEIAGFQGNCNGYPGHNSGGQTADCGQYNDQVIFNSHGSNKVDWSWTGTDNSTSTNSLRGPNLLGAALTMTYDNTVIDNSIIDEIEDIFEDIFEEIKFEKIEDSFKEEINFEEEFQFEIVEQPMDEPELEFKSMAIIAEEIQEEFFEEDITMDVKEEPIGKEPMITSMFANMPEEEIIEETNELISSFLPPPPEEKPTIKEEMVEEEPKMEKEEMIEEEPKEMASAPTEKEEEIIEESTTEEESKEMAQPNNESKEKIKEKKSTSKVAKKSDVQAKKLTKQKIVQQKKAIRDNLVKVMDKVDKDIKDISKNLQIKNIIKLDAMASEQASLDSYDVPFYKGENIYMDQIQIQDMRQLYTDVSLNNYIANDPVVIMENKLRDIETKKQLLIIELEQLKNG